MTDASTSPESLPAAESESPASENDSQTPRLESAGDYAWMLLAMWAWVLFLPYGVLCNWVRRTAPVSDDVWISFAVVAAPLVVWLAVLAAPLWLRVASIVLCLAMAVIQLFDPIGNHAIGNVVTLIVAFVASMTWIIWFAWKSGYPRGAWVTMASVSVAAIALFFTFFKIARVSAEMIPQFAPRFAPAPDEGLPQLAEAKAAREPMGGGGDPNGGGAAAAKEEPPPKIYHKLVEEVDLATTTADDYPRFLGPRGDNRVQDIALARDWKERPPRELWRIDIGAGWSAFSAVNGYAVTLEQRGPIEYVTCYRVEDGKLMWSHGIEARHETRLGGVGPRSTPTIYKGRVYALGGTGVLRCLDGATGREIWIRNVLDDVGATLGAEAVNVAYGRANSPLVVPGVMINGQPRDLVVIPGGGDGGKYTSLIAYDAMYDKPDKAGQIVWRSGNRQISYSTPVLTTLAGVEQIVIVNESSVSGHRPGAPQPGEVLWVYENFPGGSSSAASATQAVPIDAERLFLSKEYGVGGKMLRIKRQGQGFDIQVEWNRRSVMKTKFANVVVHDGHIYGLSDGILSCVELDTGRQRWRPRKATFGHGQILLAGDLLLVLGEEGDLALVDPQPSRYVELGRVVQALNFPTWNNLALYGNRLLIRNGTQAVCYELPPR